MNIDDRELLTKAAKAAGFEVVFSDGRCCHKEMAGNSSFRYVVTWNPLTDDGDALRLAVKVGMQVNTVAHSATLDGATNYAQAGERDALAATRRAIVRAAAALPPPSE